MYFVVILCMFVLMSRRHPRDTQGVSSAASEVYKEQPAQYSAAVRQADQSRRKNQFARGRARNQDVSEAALEVIGKGALSTLDDRVTIGGLSGLAMFSQPQVAIPAALATGAVYSPIGSRVTDALLRSRPTAVSNFGQQVGRAAPAAGMLSSGATLDAYR